MVDSLSPREIQARIRAGASVLDVAAAAGVDVEQILGFATPVIAEREYIANSALAGHVRKKGNGTGRRGLREIVEERLLARAIDPESVTWDSWRQEDLKWRLVGYIDEDIASRKAEFVYDPKGRYSVAANADARWLIGEQLPGQNDPDDENTIDFDDQLALVRATLSPAGPKTEKEPPPKAYPQDEDLDDLYDMMSVVSEDSVRIYVGLTDDPDQPALDEFEEEEVAPKAPPAAPVEASEPAAPEVADQKKAKPEAAPPPKDSSPKTTKAPKPKPKAAKPKPPAPEPTPDPKPKSRRRRASVPSWDEIMFGGPDKKD